MDSNLARYIKSLSPNNSKTTLIISYKWGQVFTYKDVQDSGQQQKTI